MAQITLHRPDCSVWLQIEKQWENNGLTKCILFWGGLCGVGQLSPKLLTAITASPSPAGYHRTPATPTEFCRPLRLAEKVFVCKNCFSFSWEWVIWHTWILFQLSLFFFFFKQRRLNAASFPGYVATRVPATTSCLRVPSEWSLNSSRQLVKAARSSEFSIISIYAHKDV